MATVALVQEVSEAALAAELVAVEEAAAEDKPKSDNHNEGDPTHEVAFLVVSPHRDSLHS